MILRKKENDDIFRIHARISGSFLYVFIFIERDDLPACRTINQVPALCTQSTSLGIGS